MLAGQGKAPSPSVHIWRAVLLKFSIRALIQEIAKGEQPFTADTIQNLTVLGEMFEAEVQAACKSAR